MNYIEKCQQWQEKLRNGKGDGIEKKKKNEKGGFLYRDKDGLLPVDYLFLCLMGNDRRTAEIIYRGNDNYSAGSKEQIFIKDMKKVIFIDNNEEGHGFGYNETDKAESFVMYIRIGGNVRLMWADSARDRVNFAVESNPDNPTGLDCLVEFLRRSDVTKEILDKESEG